MSNYSNGIAEDPDKDAVYIEGRVTTKMAANWSWYNHVDVFKGDGFSNLITTYSIMEIPFSLWKEWCMDGTLLLVLAIVLYVSLKAKSGIIAVVPKEKKNREPFKIFDYTNEIQAEQLRLRTLEKRLLTLKHTAMCCGGFALFGMILM